MYEFLSHAAAPHNIFYTILLTISVLYWMTVMFGMLDVDSFDIDFDFDGDVDLEVDADADVDTFGGVLHFFNFGELPFMVIFSFFSLFLWYMAIIVNSLLVNDIIWVSLLLFIPLGFVALLLTKFATYPLLKVFATMNASDDTRVEGVVGEVVVAAEHDSMGQAEVKTGDYVQRINILPNNTERLKKGEKVLILGKAEIENCYLAEHI